jgi:hypothetical protein
VVVDEGEETRIGEPDEVRAVLYERFERFDPGCGEGRRGVAY